MATIFARREISQTLRKSEAWPRWDTIIFNFQTEDPREVNWYLHHAVGCWMSKDNMNFCFEAPGRLMAGLERSTFRQKAGMPPSYFKRGSGFGGQVDHHADSAVRILKRLSSSMPGIYHGATQLPPWAYRTVADLIQQRMVKLKIKPSMEMFAAEYVARRSGSTWALPLCSQDQYPMASWRMKPPTFSPLPKQYHQCVQGRIGIFARRFDRRRVHRRECGA